MTSILQSKMATGQKATLLVNDPERIRHRTSRRHARLPVPLLVTMASVVVMLISLVPMVIYVFYENVTLARTVFEMEVRLAHLEQHVKTSQMPRGPDVYDREYVTASLDRFQIHEARNDDDVDYDDYDEDDAYVSSGDYDYDDDEFTFDDAPIQDGTADEVSMRPERRRRDASPSQDRIRHEKKKKKKKSSKPVRCLIQTQASKEDLSLDFKLKKDKDKDRCRDLLDQYVESKIEEKIPMTAIHLDGDIPLNSTMTTRLRQDPDESMEMPDRDGSMYYQGFMPNSQTMAFWSMAEWAKKSSRTNQTYHFNRREGSVEVLKTGLYFIYAQVHFHETQAYLGYHVQRASGGSRNTAFSCFTGVDPIERQPGEPTGLPLSDYARHESCNLSGMMHLRKHDRISLLNFVAHSKIDTTKQTSYWGMVLMSGMS